MSEFGTFIGLVETVSGRRLPRTPSGTIDMDRIKADNRDTFKVENQNRQHLDADAEGPTTVQDVVIEREWELYRRAAGGLTGVSVQFGGRVYGSNRLRPELSEGYAIVAAADSDTFRIYDERLETLELLLEQGETDV